jgi:hypothetical protein
MISKEAATSKLQNPALTPISILLAVLVFGAIWGLSEVTLGGGLHLGHVANKGAILTGVGMGLVCGMVLAIYRKPAMLIGVGVVAASIKLLTVPITGVPVICPANGVVAVGLQGVALSAVAFGLMKAMDKNVYARIAAGAGGALIASGLFWLIGMHVAPCRYLLTFAGAPGTWMATEGLVWAALSAVLLPVGYWAGVKLRPMVGPVQTAKVWPRYAAAASIFVFCVGMSAVALVAGL